MSVLNTPTYFMFCLITPDLSVSLISLNSENLRNHWGMNWVHYKDLLSDNCLCGTVVESLSLTQEILGSNPAVFLFDFNVCVTEFSESIWRKIHCESALKQKQQQVFNCIFDLLILGRTSVTSLDRKMCHERKLVFRWFQFILFFFGNIATILWWIFIDRKLFKIKHLNLLCIKLLAVGKLLCW